tara:strand:- start:405 stop:1124 length:720 start_codon:yes stop_codon:yes gene_type:complete
MSKIRIFVNSELKKYYEITLSKESSHYLKNVLRKKTGEKIFCFNSVFGEWLAEIILIDRFVTIKILTLKRKPHSDHENDIWVCFGLIKSRNINFLVEKTSELGISKLIPLVTFFSEQKKINIDRLNKISIEAVEQSSGILIPEITNVKKLSELLHKWDKERGIIVCNEKKSCNNILKLFSNKNFKKIAIFVGPVAGWSTEDLKCFENYDAFHVSLGKRLLKADTAAISALSCVKLFLEN